MTNNNEDFETKKGRSLRELEEDFNKLVSLNANICVKLLGLINAFNAQFVTADPEKAERAREIFFELSKIIDNLMKLGLTPEAIKAFNSQLRSMDGPADE